MADNKIISGESQEKSNPGIVIGNELVFSIEPEVSQSSTTLDQRISSSTASGGLKQLPAGFDGPESDWKVIISNNPFEILFLDYKQYKFITPEIVKENYRILESFWKEKVALMNTGGNRVAFKNKFGDGVIDSSLVKIKRAFEKINSETGLAQYYQEINNERLRKGEENLKETIEDMLLDGVADETEIRSRLEKGSKQDLSREETAIIIKKHIDARNLKPYGQVEGDTLAARLLSVSWMTQQKIEEADKFKLQQESLKIQIVPGKYATSIEEIGTILFENPNEAKEIIKEDLLKSSISQKDMVLGMEIGKLSKGIKDIDATYLNIVYKLNRKLPYRFIGRTLYQTIEELCKAIFEDDQTLKAGKIDFSKGFIETWLRETNSKGYEIFAKIRDTAENAELAFLEFLHTFNRQLPYRFAGKFMVRSMNDLCDMINKSKEDWEAGKKELFNSSVLVWLKTKGHIDVLEKWDSVKKQFKENKDVGLEAFLHLMNPKLIDPKIKADESSLSFPKIQSGDVITANLLFTNETRGYADAKLSFSDQFDGVTLSTKKISFNAAEGNNSQQVTLSIDSTVLQKGLDYKTNIQLVTTAGQNMTIPLSFRIVFPKNAFILETLKYAAIVAALLGLTRFIIAASSPGWLSYDFFLDWDSAVAYHGVFSTFGWAFFLFLTFTLGGGYFLVKYLISKKNLVVRKSRVAKS